MAPRVTKRAAAAAKNAAPVFAVSQSASDKASFLDLPAELRNHINYLLLPDEECTRWAHVGTPRLGASAPTSTNFMASCRQVYEEAASILYGGPEAFQMYVDRKGNVDFLGSLVASPEVSTTNFAAINQIKSLILVISADHTRAMCDVQDALFDVLGHLRPGHKLHTLEVCVYVRMEYDHRRLSKYPSQAKSEFEFERKLEYDFKIVRPGHHSRGHVIAFLTDPLRTIRNLKDGRKKGKFTIEFDWRSDSPWEEVQPDIKALIQGNDLVPNYRIFAVYWETLRSITRAMDNLVRVARWFRKTEDILGGILKDLQWARVRGDLSSLRKHHGIFVERLERVVENALRWADVRSYPIEIHEQVIREIIYLTEELKTALPRATVDTSFHGFSLTDAALEEYKTNGRVEKKKPKSKRKRENEDPGSPAKKAKAGRKT